MNKTATIIIIGIFTITLAGVVIANAQSVGGGGGTIGTLDQFVGTTSPYTAIAPRTHAKSIYAPFSWATTSAFAATTICLTGDACRTTWPTSGASVWPFTTTDTNYGVAVQSTTTPLWFRGTPFSLFASTTAVFVNATTSQLTVTDAWLTKLRNLTSNGFVKTDSGDGTLSIDTNTYLTGNQTITLSGDVSGSGATAITTTLGLEKVFGRHLSTSTSIANGELLSFVSATDDFGGLTCAEITGSADLCDGSDATGAGGSGNVGTSSVPVIGSLAYWTTTTATPALLGTIGTTSLAVTAPITFSGTMGAQVGGVGGSFGCTSASAGVTGCLTGTDWSTFNSKQATISATYPIILTGATLSFPATSTLYGTGTSGQVLMWSGSTPIWAATSTGGSGTVTSITGGLGLNGGAITTSGTLSLISYLATSSAETNGNLAYWTTSAGTPAKLGTVATTTLTASSPLSLSNTVWKVGGANSVLTLDTSGTWSGLAGTASALSPGANINGTAFTGASNITITAASSTLLANNNTWTGLNVFANATTTLLTAPDAWITKLRNLTSNGFVKTGSGDGTLSVDTNTYLTGNQTITLSGDVSGSGTTGITTTIGLEKIFGRHLSTTTNAFANTEVLTYVSATDDFEGKTCAEITGSADLCDGGDATGAGGGAWPFTPGTYYGQAVQATTTALQLNGSPFSLFASSTALFQQASTTQLTVSGSAYINNGNFISDSTTGTTTIANLEIGLLSQDMNAGIVNAMDSPIDTSCTSGTIQTQEYGFAGVNATTSLSIYGVCTGVSPNLIRDFRVGVGTSTPGAALMVVGTSSSPTSNTFQLMDFTGRSLLKMVDSGLLTVDNASTTNFTAGTSLQIPNSSTQTSQSLAGYLSMDTTDNQLNVGTGILDPRRALTISAPATTTWSGTTTTSFIWPMAATINSAYCWTSAGTVNMQLLYGAGSTALKMLNASSTANLNLFTANNTPTKGATSTVSFGTPASSPVDATCTFNITPTAT